MIAWALFLSLAGAAEPVAWMTITDVKAEGYATADDVQRHLRKRTNELRYCYELALREDPTVEGRLDVVATVLAKPDSDGDVRGEVPSVSSTATGNISQLLQRCTEKKPTRWLVPLPESGAGMIRFSLVYVPLVVPPSKVGGAGLVVEPHESLPHSLVLDALRPTWSEAWVAHEEAVRSGKTPVPGTLQGTVRLIGHEDASGARELGLGGVTWANAPDGAELESVSRVFGDPGADAPDPSAVFEVAVRLTLQQPD